ncbi:HIT family protein [Methylovirgula sp. 4M-Z18]|uniref:HIT family protein n=1 Tax=Methylovirgula sp. 4M-Z18 TaxID=2293567 RepID=UPI000E2EE6C8|nr:HIT family protein [Methylovirgula sp. 4M-Z18]RFB80602.1 HIT family protein [Methylovirgula sp. 4M-Z18]
MSIAYAPDNIFAKILRGELPCHKIYEDDTALAFLDIMPRADGHTLVISKAPARNLLDIAPADLSAMMPAVQKVARAVKEGMQAEGLLVDQFNESVSGQTIFHLHFHILPRWSGVELRPHAGIMAKPEILAAHAEKIKAALAQS